MKTDAPFPEMALANVHWSIPRPLNPLFTGRTQVVEQIKGALSPTPESMCRDQQRRFVLTGLGGQGKSEICLKVADLLRET